MSLGFDSESESAGPVLNLDALAERAEPGFRAACQVHPDLQHLVTEGEAAPGRFGGPGTAITLLILRQALKAAMPEVKTYLDGVCDTEKAAHPNWPMDEFKMVLDQALTTGGGFLAPGPGSASSISTHHVSASDGGSAEERVI